MTKTIYFHNTLGKFVKAISFIMALILEIVYLALSPAKYMGIKAHLFTALMATAGGFYMHFITGTEHAAMLTAATFVGFALVVAFAKLFRKAAAKAEKFFLKIYDCPVGVYVTYRPLFS